MLHKHEAYTSTRKNGRRTPEATKKKSRCNSVGFRSMNRSRARRISAATALVVRSFRKTPKVTTNIDPHKQHPRGCQLVLPRQTEAPKQSQGWRCHHLSTSLSSSCEDRINPQSDGSQEDGGSHVRTLLGACEHSV